ncbi:hypothetical protein RRG08_020231 [Elysia crispata]|uniref:Uncharacterized protein n=1 Tax=Elysia crispata TaxID=231223 RepID=A0AAE1A3C4_9GAST|nr:hypothetical protein RRG08_020231 [Elysia crispata]
MTRHLIQSAKRSFTAILRSREKSKASDIVRKGYRLHEATETRRLSGWVTGFMKPQRHGDFLVGLQAS